MIRINLLGEKVDMSGSYVLQVFGGVTAVCIVLMTCFFVHQTALARLEDRRSEKHELDTKLAKLKKITQEVAELEQKKKTLREKLHTIATLKAKQHGPVRILDDINTAIPERAWLLLVKEKGGYLTIDGVALDNQTIAMFMSNLGKSKFFGEVGLNHATTHKVDDVKLKKFSLSVQVRDALAAQAIKGVVIGEEGAVAASAEPIPAAIQNTINQAAGGNNESAS